MAYSAKLQRVVESVLRRHSVQALTLETRFQIGDSEHLVVTQTPDGRQIRLSRVTGYASVQRQELEIMLFVDEEGRWIPYEYFRPATGREVCGTVNRQTQTLVLSNPYLQRGLVIQCDLWATRLQHEGWLERSTIATAGGQASDDLMLWPIPTVAQPNDDTLEAWLMDVEVCEATDGCPTDLDGACPHGYPSWPRYLGLV